jgi:hypothetical protein
MKNQDTQLNEEWVAIFVLLLVFWPVGLFMLVKKLSTDKSAAFGEVWVKAISTIGKILLAIGALLAAMTNFRMDGFFGYIPAVIFIGGGITLIYRAHKMRVDAHKYRKYISIVVNEGETSLSGIAQIVGLSPEATKKDLNTMFEKGFFQGHINVKEDRLVLTHHGINGDKSSSLIVVVRCDNCGADNKMISGSAHKCEYCRSLINVGDNNKISSNLIR